MVSTEDLQHFVDAIEKAEKRKDSMILRDIQVALPHELTEDQQLALASDFAELMSQRYHTPIPWAVHRPDKDQRRGAEAGDQRNVHAHLSMPTRAIDQNGRFAQKLRQFHGPSGSAEVATVRNAWQECANRHLALAGGEARVHVGRRLDRPGRHGHRGNPRSTTVPAGTPPEQPRYAKRAEAPRHQFSLIAQARRRVLGLYRGRLESLTARLGRLRAALALTLRRSGLIPVAEALPELSGAPPPPDPGLIAPYATGFHRKAKPPSENPRTETSASKHRPGS